jgi:heme/copper-type cytochrome/quinol oxidase subunit 2
MIARLQLRLAPWAAPAALVTLVALALFAPLPAWGAPPEERHITVNARTFAFEPGTVRVNRGDTVVIRLESSDVVHGLFVDGYEVSTVAEPGRPGELRFVAGRSGAFRMRCSISCGNMHPFMIGKLVVGPNVTWLRALLATLITAGGAVVIFRPKAASGLAALG